MSESTIIDNVYTHLGVDAKETMQRRAVAYIFDRTREDVSAFGLSNLDNHFLTTAETYRDVSNRLSSAKKYKDDFFSGRDMQDQPLMLAVICAHYMPRLQESMKDEAERAALYAKYFNKDMLEDAVKIWKEAHSLSQGNTLAVQPREESVFLAHIFGIDLLKAGFEAPENPSMLEKIINKVPQLRHVFPKESEGLFWETPTTKSDLFETLEAVVKPLMALARRETDIGKMLWEKANHVKAKIEERIDPSLRSEPPPGPPFK